MFASTTTPTETSPMTFTNNGAISLATTQPLHNQNMVHGRVSFFFKAVRSLLKDTPQLYQYLSLADQENVRDTLVLVFQLRNCRSKSGGKGERDLFRLCVAWYCNHDKGYLLEKNLSQVVRFGRWDDVLICPGGYEYMAAQLISDYNSLLNSPTTLEAENLSVSLAAKWAPSNNAKQPSTVKHRQELIRAMNQYLQKNKMSVMGTSFIREAEYRKILSFLREKLMVVEKLMCGQRWTEIDFNHVPSNAMHLYGKTTLHLHKKRKTSPLTLSTSSTQVDDETLTHHSSAPPFDTTPNTSTNITIPGAFMRHLPTEFTAWKNSLKSGVNPVDGTLAKVNSLQLFPYQVLTSYRNHHLANIDPLLEAQWKNFEDHLHLTDCLFVTDVSGSMNANLPNSTSSYLDVAVSLSILGARSCQEPFKNVVITFSSQPTFVELTGQTLLENMININHMSWGMNTNLQLVFEIILQRALNHQLSPEAMPKYIFIVSDMEFDACSNNKETNFESISAAFARSAYQRPTLIFWNVNSTDSKQFPVTADENGTILISGFSPSIMEEVTKGDFKDFTPWKMVQKIINNPIYQDIVV